MTAPPAETCGHRWGTDRTMSALSPRDVPGHTHLCERPDGHEHDMLLRQPQQCRCRCGATTTRERA